MSGSRSIFNKSLPFISPGGYPSDNISEIVDAEIDLGFDNICISLHNRGQWGFSRYFINSINGLIERENGSLEITSPMSLSNTSSLLRLIESASRQLKTKAPEKTIKVSLPGPKMLLEWVRPDGYGPYYNDATNKWDKSSILSDITDSILELMKHLSTTSIDGIQIDEVISPDFLSYEESFSNIFDNFNTQGQRIFKEIRVFGVVNLNIASLLKNLSVDILSFSFASAVVKDNYNILSMLSDSGKIINCGVEDTIRPYVEVNETILNRLKKVNEDILAEFIGVTMDIPPTRDLDTVLYRKKCQGVSTAIKLFSYS